MQGTCEDEAAIMYAWARNAPPTKLPKGTSMTFSVLNCCSERGWSFIFDIYVKRRICRFYVYCYVVYATHFFPSSSFTVYIHEVLCPLLTTILCILSDVGFKVGRSSGMSYFVLQIHYGDISAFKGESF